MLLLTPLFLRMVEGEGTLEAPYKSHNTRLHLLIQTDQFRALSKPSYFKICMRQRFSKFF